MSEPILYILDQPQYEGSCGQTVAIKVILARTMHCLVIENHKLLCVKDKCSVWGLYWVVAVLLLPSY